MDRQRHLRPGIATTLLILVSFACQLLPTLRPADLSTDEGVAQAYSRATGKDLVLDDLCIQRPDELQNIVVVGFFAYDAGCDYDEVFVDGKLGDISQMTQAGLSQNGWANETGRAELALIWTKEVLYLESSLLSRANDDFEGAGQAFSAPSSVLNSSGSVTIRAWIRAPAGMLAEENYSWVELVYSADASEVTRTTLASFKIEF